MSGVLFSEVLSSRVRVGSIGIVLIVLWPPAWLGSKFIARCAIDIHRCMRSFVYVFNVA